MNKKYILIAAILLIVCAFGYKEISKESKTIGGGLSEPKCNVSSTEYATVGKDIGSTLLSANEARAWARIQLNQGMAGANMATTSVWLSFDEGATAVVGEGVALATTTKDDSIVFGRATQFPYTGAVTGISNYGTTTALVTECSY